MDNHNNNSSPSRIRPILTILLLITGIYIVVDHAQHIAPFLPFTFLLGCLFMHLFMHHGHTHHHNHDQNKNT